MRVPVVYIILTAALLVFDLSSRSLGDAEVGFSQTDSRDADVRPDRLLWGCVCCIIIFPVFQWIVNGRRNSTRTHVNLIIHALDTMLMQKSAQPMHET